MPLDPLTGLLTGRKPPRTAPPGAQFTAPPNYRALNTGYGGGDYTQMPTVIPGFTPDYQSLIQNDPAYHQSQLDLNAAGISDAASRAAATQKALINFGLSPDFAAANNQLGINQSFLASDITPEAKAAAAGNKLSINQRIEDAYKQNLNALRVSLRQRGASRSGEAGYGQQQALNQFDAAKYDATKTLLDYISGVHAAFATGEKDRQRQLAQEQQDAALRQAQLNPAQPDTTALLYGTPSAPPALFGPAPGSSGAPTFAPPAGAPSIKSVLAGMYTAPAKKKVVQPLLRAR